jgi:hypothetical protein
MRVVVLLDWLNYWTKVAPQAKQSRWNYDFSDLFYLFLVFFHEILNYKVVEHIKLNNLIYSSSLNQKNVLKMIFRGRIPNK